MNYIKKRFCLIIIFSFIIIILLIFRLKTGGKGYDTWVTGNSEPLSWTEILLNYPKIFVAFFIIFSIGIYIDYWDFKKRNQNKEK